MSSNIKVQRICQYCGNEFTARTTVTQYCSDVCNKRAYKEKIRNKKVEVSNTETRKIRNRPVEELKTKEFLTVTQVSKLIGCSRQNVYKLIHLGKLKATNILTKKTIVKRSDIDKLFEPPPMPIKEIEPKEYNISECYTMAEIQNKFGISEKALYETIKRNKIPKLKKGRFVYVLQSRIDSILGTEK